MARKRNNNKPYRPPGPPPGKPKGGLLARLLAENENAGNASFRGTPAAFPHPHGYSLAEEARNTAYNRRGMRGIDARLRYQPVTFVSAGLMDPLKDLEVEQKKFNQPEQVNKAERTEKAESHENGPLPKVTVTGDNTQDPIIKDESAGKGAGTSEVVVDQHSAPSFTLDLTGDKSLRPSHEPIPSMETIPGPGDESDSSEEVILFKGRDASRQNRASAEPIRSQGKSDQRSNKAKGPLEFREMSLELRVVEKSLPKISEPVQKQEHTHQTAPQKVDTKMNDDNYLSLSTTKKRRQKRRNTSRRNPGKFTNRESPSTAEDEEAAIVADYIANMQDDTDEDDASDDGQPSIVKHAFNILRDLGGTDSEAVPKEVTSDGDTSDGSPDSESTDGSDQRRRRELDDERMARILAKQEELGLGGDEAYLLDEAVSDDDDDDWQPASKTTPRRRKKGSSKQARIVQRKGQYPSATEMADAFDDLDLVMDWHRPSLNNFKKQSKSFDVSDSELEEAMNLTYQKDRQKKAEKKKAREELRSQGLLGKNVKPDDLRVKYRGGMSLDDLANELESFLTGTQQQLSLPPFDKRSRMTVHQLANKFKIKSQSAGKGNDRYTVLYRSRATLPFDQVFFDRAFARTRQTWFPRVDVDDETVNKARILKRDEPRRTRGKQSNAYREGDIVGQHATELGAENKGRTMLEKMGWSKGMALGSSDNKGIMVPLTQVVKKSKAGLGDT